MQEFHKPCSVVSRRRFVATTAAAAVALHFGTRSVTAENPVSRSVQTVLGPIAPEALGVTLMHEHAPVVDWSELYETQPAPIASDRMLAYSAQKLDEFHATLTADQAPGAIVETTPIRVGRYPELLVDLARRTKV